MTSVEREIRKQPEDLLKVYEYMKNWKIPSFLKNSDIVYFVGCGSSYYLALAASRYFTLRTGIETKAIPGGEVHFAFDENIGKGSGKVGILISRSGESTEVLLAGEKFRKSGIQTLGVTLEKESSLAKLTTESLILPVEETSIVMTCSFSSILEALEMIADKISGENLEMFSNILDKSQMVVERSFDIVEKKKFHSYKRFVFLGLGVYEAIAREGALKLEEMSLSITEAFSTYEYRHGPKSMVERGTLIILISRGNSEERKLIDELKSYGGEVVTVGAKGSDIFISDDIPRNAFLGAIFPQILGLLIAKEKKLDVEKPRNLTKVVKLEN